MLRHDLAVVDRADVAVAGGGGHARSELREREGDDGTDEDDGDEDADDLDGFFLECDHDVLPFPVWVGELVNLWVDNGVFCNSPIIAKSENGFKENS